jgi:hypothetical protein
MTTVEKSELTEILDLVKLWSPEARITLVRRILETVEAAPLQAGRRPAQSVRELIGIGVGDTPPPDDDTVRRWIDEHRMEKYG